MKSKVVLLAISLWCFNDPQIQPGMCHTRSNKMFDYFLKSSSSSETYFKSKESEKYEETFSSPHQSSRVKQDGSSELPEENRNYFDITFVSEYSISICQSLPFRIQLIWMILWFRKYFFIKWITISMAKKNVLYSTTIYRMNQFFHILFFHHEIVFCFCFV